MKKLKELKKQRLCNHICIYGKFLRVCYQLKPLSVYGREGQGGTLCFCGAPIPNFHNLFNSFENQNLEKVLSPSSQGETRAQS